MAHRPDYESADYKEGYEDGKREANKQWVGLSDDEILDLATEFLESMSFIGFAHAIEAKLKEKNELFGNSR